MSRRVGQSELPSPRGTGAYVIHFSRSLLEPPIWHIKIVAAVSRLLKHLNFRLPEKQRSLASRSPQTITRYRHMTLPHFHQHDQFTNEKQLQQF